MSETKRTVKVACLIPNGLMIRLMVPSQDHETGRPCLVPGGAGVRLNGPSAQATGVNATSRPDLGPGVTETVDADFMSEWLSQNEKNPIVATGQVWVIEENPTEP